MLLPISLVFLLAGAVAQCPPGTQPLYNNGNQVSTCSPQNSCSCSTQRAGYFCQYSSQHSRYVCCGAASSQCPSSAAQITDSGTTVSCQMNSCATGYMCNQGVCCANLNTPECNKNNNGNNGGVTPCLSGQVLINGVCMFQVAVGSLCQRNEQCLGGSSCLSGRCQCANGYYPQNGQCISNQGLCQIGTTLIDGKCLSLASPGSSCISSNQCIDNSYCNNGICTCNTAANMVNGYCIPYQGGPCQQTQTMVNGQCVTYSTVGGSCQAEAQCVGGSTCQVSQCVCRTGYSAMYGYCIQNPNGNNDCQPNQVLINGYCYNQVSQGGSCMFSEQCLNNAYCNSGVCTPGSGGNCNIETQFSSWVSVNGQCLSLAGLNELCSRTEQCLSASQCTNSRCQCTNSQSLVNGVCTGGNGCSFGQVLYNSQCISAVSIGANCQAHIQCGGNSRCVQSYCRCPTGTTQQNNQCINPCGQNNVNVNGQCFPTVQLGGSCTYNEQCMSGSQCLSRFCSCPSGTTLNNGQCSTNIDNGCTPGMIKIINQCYPLVSSGGSCSYTQQCQGTNMQCISSRCQSNPCGNNNQVYVNGQCMQTAQIGGYCSSSEQCLGFSQCLSGYCTCPSGTINSNQQCVTNNPTNSCSGNQVFVNNQCYPIVQVGGSCTYTEQCEGSNMLCSTGICRQNPCPNGQVYVNNQCLPMVQIGGSCTYNEQCQGTNVECNINTRTCTVSNKPTQCNNGMIYILNQCYPMVQSGGSCSYTQQCQGTNMQCISSRCQSNPCGNNNQVYVNGQCMQTAQIGGYCSFSEQCLGFSQCLSGYCTCPSGTINSNQQCVTNNPNSCSGNQVSINNQCYPIVQVGGSCSFTQQCQGSNMLCSTGICRQNTCPNGQVYVNNQCYPVIHIGGSCTYNEQCQGTNVQCNRGICSNSNIQCPNGVFVNNQCYPIVQVGGSCTYTEQCQGSNMLCSTGICRQNPCPNGQVYVNNQCLPMVQIGGSCTYNEQCQGTNVECNSNTRTCTTTSVVQCPNGVFVNNQCYPLVQSGGSCSYTQQCQGTNMQCLSNRCQPGSPSNSMCAANEQPAYTNGALVDCLKSACPSSSYCTYSNAASQYICCKTSSTTNPGSQLTCTNPAHSVVLQNNSPINCLLSNCPTSSYCDYDRQFSQYMCCQASTTTPTNICSGNYYQNSNGSPYVCTSDSSCQFGNYRYCRRASNSVTYSVCCDRS